LSKFPQTLIYEGGIARITTAKKGGPRPAPTSGHVIRRGRACSAPKTDGMELSSAKGVALDMTVTQKICQNPPRPPFMKGGIDKVQKLVPPFEKGGKG